MTFYSSISLQGHSLNLVATRHRLASASSNAHCLAQPPLFQCTCSSVHCSNSTLSIFYWLHHFLLSINCHLCSVFLSSLGFMVHHHVHSLQKTLILTFPSSFIIACYKTPSFSSYLHSSSLLGTIVYYGKAMSEDCFLFKFMITDLKGVLKTAQRYYCVFFGKSAFIFSEATFLYPFLSLKLP